MIDQRVLIISCSKRVHRDRRFTSREGMIRLLRQDLFYDRATSARPSRVSLTYHANYKFKSISGLSKYFGLLRLNASKIACHTGYSRRLRSAGERDPLGTSTRHELTSKSDRCLNFLTKDPHTFASQIRDGSGDVTVRPALVAGCCEAVGQSRRGQEVRGTDRRDAATA